MTERLSMDSLGTVTPLAINDDESILVAGLVDPPSIGLIRVAEGIELARLDDLKGVWAVGGKETWQGSVAAVPDELQPLALDVAGDQPHVISIGAFATEKAPTLFYRAPLAGSQDFRRFDEYAMLDRGQGQ